MSRKKAIRAAVVVAEVKNTRSEGWDVRAVDDFETALRNEGYTVVPQKLLSKLLSYSFKYLCIMRKQK